MNTRAISTNRQLTIFDLQFFFFGFGVAGPGEEITVHFLHYTGVDFVPLFCRLHAYQYPPSVSINIREASGLFINF